MLSISHASARFGENAVLDDASLSLGPGEMVGLVAPNGRGKTTFLRIAAGARSKALDAEVSADGVSPRQESAFRRLVFYAPGDGSLLHPNLTPRQHLEMTRRLWETHDDIDELAEACRMGGYLDRPARALSQGMRQQVSLAIAYLTHARYLLLDEPMNALDPTNVRQNTILLRLRAEEGTGIVMSSHILDNVDEACHSVCLIHDGRLLRHALSQESARSLYWRHYTTKGDDADFGVSA